MKILALEVEVPGVKSESFSDELKKAEAKQVWDLYQAGVLREMYFRADRSDAVLVLECDNLASACKTIDSLPMVAAKLIDFDLIPLRPYPGLARLFA